MKAQIRWILGAGCAIALLPAVALAQDTTTTTTTTTVVQPVPQITVQAGGGLNQFTTKLNSQTLPGWNWDVRAMYGTTTPIGVEAAYIGSTNQIAHTNDSYFLRNGGEALIRANILPIAGLNPNMRGVTLAPYVAAGFGASSDMITDSSGSKIRASSDGKVFPDSRTTTDIPVAAGVDAFIGKNVNVGARVGYKWGFNNKIFAEDSTVTAQSLQLTARAGVAF